MFGAKYGRKQWYPNIGLPSYIIKDGFFQVYYGDSHDLKCSSMAPTSNSSCTVQNTSSSGAGNPDQGVAVVRAKVADVVAAAKKGEGVEWHKLHNGSWTEKGMGGKFTPLNLPPSGYMHGDAAFVKPINKYVLAQQTGGRIQHTKAWRQSIVLSFSVDGLTWGPWQLVYNITDASVPGKPGHKGGQVVYPSLMSHGSDNEVLGKTFAVVFQVRQGNSSGPPFQYSYVNVTVK